jgi:predicted exporter
VSAIGVPLNALLVALLAAALVLGWRLDRRLKALKAAHASFLEAVRQLDQTIARARAGLAELRVVAAVASDQLDRRIERAEMLAAQLEPPAKLAAERQSPLARHMSDVAPRSLSSNRAERIERLLALARRPAFLEEAPEGDRDEELFDAPTSLPACGAETVQRAVVGGPSA